MLKGNWLFCSRAELPPKHLSAQPASPPSPVGQPWSPGINHWGGLRASTACSREGCGLPCLIEPFRLASHLQKRPLCPTTICSSKEQTREPHPSKTDANEEHQPISNPPADPPGVPESWMCCRVFTYSDYTKSLLKSSFEVIQAIHVLGYF